MTTEVSVTKKGILMKYDGVVESKIEWEDIYMISYALEKYTIEGYTFGPIETFVFDLVYGENIEITSEMGGWKKLIKNLDNHLEFKEENWKKKIEKCEPNGDYVTIYIKED